MAMIGGDASALFNFAMQLRERRRNIERAANRLGGLVRAAEWVGPDRERFLSEWNERHAPALMGVCADLDGGAQQVTGFARAQEEASRG
jgi:hypothetical protein